MKITVVGTGSTGNCYVLEHGGRYLVLDAGVSTDKVLEAVDYSPELVDACLITHLHKDHILYAPYFINSCIDVYMSEITADLANFPKDNMFIHTGTGLQRFGEWKALPFEVEHDAPGTVGFLISIANNTICYITDTGFVQVAPQGVNILIIECNYIDDMLSPNLAPEQQTRLKKYHMSLDRTKSFISKMDRSKLKYVLLVHMSQRHGFSDRMASEVSEVAGDGVVVDMATAGKEIQCQF